MILKEIDEWLWKKPTIGGDSPVVKISERSSGIPSRAGHVEPCLNPGGPSSKAKYSLPTDSELVPRGKGEKKA